MCIILHIISTGMCVGQALTTGCADSVDTFSLTGDQSYETIGDKPIGIIRVCVEIKYQWTPDL